MTKPESKLEQYRQEFSLTWGPHVRKVEDIATRSQWNKALDKLIELAKEEGKAKP